MGQRYNCIRTLRVDAIAACSSGVSVPGFPSANRVSPVRVHVMRVTLVPTGTKSAAVLIFLRMSEQGTSPAALIFFHLLLLALTLLFLYHHYLVSPGYI